MATGPYTLLDIAVRNKNKVSSLIEGIITYAPELKTLPWLSHGGISYTTLTRTYLPSGSFSQVGGGVAIQKSEWKREPGSMYKFEAQMKIAEDVVIASMAEKDNLVIGDVLADEALATMKGSAITIGSQVWYGTKASANGFAGLSNAIVSGNVVDAGGAHGSDSTSAYLVYMDDSPVNPQGVHGLIGNGGRMTFSDTWLKQQGLISGSGATATYGTYFFNNFMSFMGLVVPRSEALWQISNIIPGTNNLTDDLCAQLISKVPLALIADRSKWRWFLNPRAIYSLRKSRTSINYQPADGKGTPAFAPEPTEICGIPIVPTESIINTERNGAHQ